MAAKFFGLFLLERGVLTSAQLMHAVAEQKPTTSDVGLWLRAIDAGLLTPADLDKADAARKSPDEELDDLIVSVGLLGEPESKELRATSPRERLHLGESLIETGVLTPKELAKHIEAFHQEAKEVSGILAELYHELPNANVLEVITGVTIRMFQRMLHAFVKPSSLRTNPKRTFPSAYTVQQEIFGDFTGVVGLNFSASMLKAIASRLLGGEVTTIDKDTLDAASEFINIIGGNVCAELSGSGMNLTIAPPTVKECENDDIDVGDNYLTATALAHPDEHIEVCILDTTAKAQKR